MPAPISPPRAVQPRRATTTPPSNGSDSPKSGGKARTIATGAPSNAPGHRIVIFGPGGIGKTTLAATAPEPVAFFDLDDSLSRLRSRFKAMELLDRFEQVQDIMTWQDLRDALNADGWDKFRTIVVDSCTKAEELCVAHVVATVPSDGGRGAVQRIEDYGYGKGYQHVYETFLGLLADLDRHTRVGRHVVLICHDCNSTVPNPMGQDWIRYEPRLQTSNSGKASIRLRVKEWADHVLFAGYDVDVDKDGKGIGHGSATLYPSELPHFMAKSRTLIEPMPLDQCHTGLWDNILI